MKWFDRWFARKMEQAWNESREKNLVEPTLGISSKDIVYNRDVIAVENELSNCDHYTLSIWKAQGGRCIQYRRYDRNNDQFYSNLHVVSDDQDLGDAIKNIVVQEALVGN